VGFPITSKCALQPNPFPIGGVENMKNLKNRISHLQIIKLWCKVFPIKNDERKYCSSLRLEDNCAILFVPMFRANVKYINYIIIINVYTIYSDLSAPLKSHKQFRPTMISVYPQMTQTICSVLSASSNDKNVLCFKQPKRQDGCMHFHVIFRWKVYYNTRLLYVEASASTAIAVPLVTN